MLTSSIESILHDLILNFLSNFLLSFLLNTLFDSKYASIERITHVNLVYTQRLDSVIVINYMHLIKK